MKEPQTTIKPFSLEELKEVAIKGCLPRCKKQAIEQGDVEWLERLHEIERKYVHD